MSGAIQDATGPLASISWMNTGPVSLFYMHSMCAGQQPDQKQKQKQKRSFPREYIHSTPEAMLFQKLLVECLVDTHLIVRSTHNGGRDLRALVCVPRRIRRARDLRREQLPLFLFLRLSLSVFRERRIRKKRQAWFFICASCLLASYTHARRRVRPHRHFPGLGKESRLWFEPEGLWDLALYRAHCAAISLALLLAPVSLPQGLCPSNTWLCNNGLLCATPPELPRTRLDIDVDLDVDNIDIDRRGRNGIRFIPVEKNIF